MIELLKKLIQADSTLATGEVDAANVLCEYFIANGVDCEVDCFDGNRANAIARVKGGDGKALMFAAHIDVVPAGDVVWEHPPFDAVEVDGKIFGRGSTDMKAGVAATAAAIVDIVKSGAKLSGDIIFAATAGEETDSCGIKKFMADNADSLPKLAGILIPEPTDFDIVTAHRGILWLEITTKGKTAHGSMPHLGINAVMHMSALLERLRNYEVPCQPHPIFGKCSFSVNGIAGGQAPNVVPDSCTIKIDTRTVPGQNHQDVIDDLERIFKEIKAEHPDFEASVKIARSCGGIATDNNSQFVKSLCKATEIPETKSVGYTTDAPNMLSLNVPIAIFGPGKCELCHKPNEYVDITDLEQGKDYLIRVIKEFLT